MEENAFYEDKGQT